MQLLQLAVDILLSPIKAPIVHVLQDIFPFNSVVACSGSHCMQMKGLALGPMIQLLHAYVVAIVRLTLGPTSLLIVF